jgi:hypothetical protein
VKQMLVKLTSRPTPERVHFLASRLGSAGITAQKPPTPELISSQIMMLSDALLLKNEWMMCR